jgi:hypothetical protein
MDKLRTDDDMRTKMAYHVAASFDDRGELEVSYAELASKLHEATETFVPLRSKASPRWFAGRESELRPLVDARNSAIRAHVLQPNAHNSRKKAATRQALQAAVRAAKSDWIVGKCKQLNDGIASKTGTKAAWKVAADLKKGLEAPRIPAPVKMQKSDGSSASSPQENAEVFATHFANLYECTGTWDAEVIGMLPQRPVRDDLGLPPYDGEIEKATKGLNHSSPGLSGLPAAVW